MAFSIARRSASPTLEPCSASSLLGGVDERLGVVLRFDLRLALLILLGVGFGVLDHFLDVGLAQAARRLDADLLLLAGALLSFATAH